MIFAIHCMLLVAGAASIFGLVRKRDPATWLMVILGISLAVVLEYSNDGFYPVPPLYYVAPRLWVLPDSNIPVSMLAYVALILLLCATFGRHLKLFLASRAIHGWISFVVRVLAQVVFSGAIAAVFEYGFAMVGLLVWRLEDPQFGPLLGTFTATFVCLVSYAAAHIVMRLVTFKVRGTNLAP